MRTQQKTKKVKFIIKIVVTVLTALCLFHITSYAFQYEPITVNVNISANEEMDIVVEGIDNDTIKQYHINNTQSIPFEITEPGEYRYYVYQKIDNTSSKDKNVQYDTDKRHLLIYVSEKDSILDASVIVTRTNSNTKPDNISFENKRTEEETTHIEPPTTTPEEKPTTSTEVPTTTPVPTPSTNITTTTPVVPNIETPQTVTEVNTGDRNLVLPIIVCLIALIALCTSVYLSIKRKKDSK